MLFDLNKNFVDLDGNELVGQNHILMSKFLANILASDFKSVGALKAMEWALKLNSEHSIEIDTTDLPLLTNGISQAAIPNLFKYGLLKALEVIPAC